MRISSTCQNCQKLFSCCCLGVLEMQSIQNNKICPNWEFETYEKLRKDYGRCFRDNVMFEEVVNRFQIEFLLCVYCQTTGVFQ